jgi:predicted lysophospholipase L1 biosynthesis ABC-type transport system permease subunit
MFPNEDAVNRHITWTDPVMKFIGLEPVARRIVGIAADVDDENVVPEPALSVYHSFEQETGLFIAGRLFVRARTDPYALVPPITRIVRELSADQPIERAATLEDVRAEVLSPDRLNTLVFGGFAAVALTIAIIGVAGVLAFSVSGRTREFGIRLAVGSQPRHLLAGVLGEGAVMAGIGVVSGAIVGYALARTAASYIQNMQIPGALPTIGSAVVLLVAAVVASVLPAARAARVDVMQALRSD